MNKIIVSISNVEDINLYKNADAYIVSNASFCVKYPSSMSVNDIKNSITLAHSLNKEVILNINKVFLNDELKDLEEFIDSFKDLDGYMVADLGVYNILKRKGLENKVIYNPETLIVNYFDMNFCFKLNMKSVVLSKEMTLDNIIKSIEHAKKDVIVYSFGFYHMFYSRRKLVKNYFDEIKESNKHEKEHLLLKEATRENKYHIYQDDNGTLITNSDIFCNINYLDEIKADYLIDSYDLDKNYVNDVINAYRRRINGEYVDINEIQHEKYSFTEGFLFRKIGAR